MSSETFSPAKKKTSEKSIAHAKKIASLGGRKSAEVRGALVKKRKLNELKVLKMVKQMILQKSADLVRAAMIPAMGQHFVYEIVRTKNEKGRVTSEKHVLVEDPHKIAYALDCISNESGKGDDDEFFYVSVKDPDFRAVEMLMNRAIGKIPESLKVSGSVEHKFSLSTLARDRENLPAHVPVPIAAQVLDTPENIAEDTP